MQFCIVVAVVASLAAAESAGPNEVAFGLPKLVAVLLCQVLVVVVAWAIVGQTKADTSTQWMDRREVNRRLERRHKFHLGVWLVSSLCILICFDWATMVAHADFGGLLLLDRLLLLMPVLSPLVLSWAVFYDAECALDPSFHIQSRWRHVFDHMRSSLFLPLVPVLFVIGWCDAFDYLAPNFAGGAWSGPLHAIPLLVAVLVFPLILRGLWRTKSLAAGSLRNQLEQRSRQLGFSTKDILVWHTQHRSRNAAVTGLIPQLRYVLLTDRLIQELPSDQIESVFLHEVAHAKLHHSLKLMFTLIVVLGAGCFFVVSAASTNALSSIPSQNGWAALLLLIFVIFVASVMVGRYARLFELQADVWAAERAPDSQQYLRAIAAVAVGLPDQATWLHPSFRQRCDLLSQGDGASVWLRRRSRVETAIFVVWTCGFSVASAMLSRAG